MLNSRRFLIALSSRELTPDFYQALEIPDPESFPRPGDATGKDRTEIVELVEEMGYEFDRHATHSDLYKHTIFPGAIIGVATTTSDVRAVKNLLASARNAYLEEVVKIHDALVVLGAVATSLERGKVALTLETEKHAYLVDAVKNFIADLPPGKPDAPCPPYSKMKDRWYLKEIIDDFDELDKMSKELSSAAVEEERRAFSADVKALLKTATEANGIRCRDALRKLKKEFNLGAKSCLKKCGVPEDCAAEIEDYIYNDTCCRMPQETADDLEALLQAKRDEKKGKKTKSDRQPVTTPTPLEQLEQKLKKLPTMDITKLIGDNIASLERRHEEREKLLREALQEQVNRAVAAESALKTFEDRVGVLEKLAEEEAERADALADELDKARASAADISAVQKLISELHVAVDGFRVKHAQADLEKIEEIILAFQVEEGVEA